MRITKLAALFFVMLSASITKGQDTIHMRSGEIVVAKVSEVGTTEIKYTKWGRVDGPNYTVLKTDVASIRYPDGSQDVFTLPPAVSAPPLQNNETGYGGIGATIKQDSNYVQLTGTDAGSPAAKAGLGAGDKIVAVNGTSTYGKTIFEVSSMIVGQAGTPVMLEIIHPGTSTPVEISIIRESAAAYSNQQAATLQNLSALSQYLNSIPAAPTQGLKYTMNDSTVNNMAKFRIGMDFYNANLLEETGRLNASISDYRNFMLGGYYGLNNEYGAEGAFYFIKSKKTQTITIPFRAWDVWQGYTATHMVRYTVCTVQHSVEKAHDFGIHFGYAQKNLSDASEAWLLYDRWGGEANDISLYNKNLVDNPLPTYNEIAIGLQYVLAFSYKAHLSYYNGAQDITSSRKTVFTFGFDILIFPTLPKLDATYDSLSSNAAQAANTAQSQYGYDSWSAVPSNTFTSYGWRFYCKWQWSFHNGGDTDWGWEVEAALEQNIAGIGYMTETGLYFGL
jgi:membrane-associated protease RseP (regulator of RpoE activity)